MARSDLPGLGMLPALAVVAGVLSSTLWRPATPSQQSAEAAPTREQHTESRPAEPGPRLVDLWPTLELLGESLGVDVSHHDIERSARALEHDVKEGSTRPTRAEVNAAEQLRKALETQQVVDPDLHCPPKQLFAADAREIDGYLRPDVDPGGRLHELRTKVVDAFFDEYDAQKALCSLVTTLKAGDDMHPGLRVDFTIATIPDYVDSYSGWTADESVSGIQAGMARAGYLLDRFRLIEWSRTDRADQPAPESHLHERQPGAIIFRRVEPVSTETAVPAKEQVPPTVVHLQVVLLVLETPTSGIHLKALQNAIRFVNLWTRVSRVDSPLQILGPTFSGSTQSLAVGLEELAKEKPPYREIRVISGSATADENPKTLSRFAPQLTTQRTIDERLRLTYHTTVQPTRRHTAAMAEFLERMNPAWKYGHRVAILQESNTVYGWDVGRRTKECSETDAAEPFGCAQQYQFPLHIAQLRNDASSAAPAFPSLLPTASVPLDMRERTPPTDLVPALRPQLTSPIVEATMQTMLDNIRHEGITAVGIVATDDRDTLFLAREVKRAAPDVQLFLYGANALYLHPDYLAYTRGTLVASTYPLSLINQFAVGPNRAREPFQSMVAEGVFNATLAILSQQPGGENLQQELLDYCDGGTQYARGCQPRVLIGVIGEDGYWRLGSPRTATPVQTQMFVAHQAAKPTLTLPPMPEAVWLIMILVLCAILAHVGLALVVGHSIADGRVNCRYLSWPFVRVFAPPVTHPSIAANHRMAVVLCFVLMALYAAWLSAIGVLFVGGGSTPLWVAWGASIGAFAIVAGAGLFLQHRSKQAGISKFLVPNCRTAEKSNSSPYVRLLILGLLATTLIVFGVFIFQELLNPKTTELQRSWTLARLVGGGITSPAATSLLLFAAIYSGMFAGLHRLSMVGNGYITLATESSALKRLMGIDVAPDGGEGSLPATLDVPLQQVPWICLLGAGALLFLGALSLWPLSSIDRRAFSLFMFTATTLILSFAMLQLIQGLVTWQKTRRHLVRLGHSPLEPSLASVAHLIRWDLSPVAPRLSELMPIASRADSLVNSLVQLANDRLGSEVLGDPRFHLRDCRDLRLLRRWYEPALKLRCGDLEGVIDTLQARTPQTDERTSHVDGLLKEMQRQDHAPLMQSWTWFQLWGLTNALVPLLDRVHWNRSGIPAQKARVRAAASPALSAVAVGAGVAVTHDDRSHRKSLPKPIKLPSGSATFLSQCESMIALQFAFILRDILARIMTSLFTAMICLGLLTAGHLMYLFQGRSSALILDLLAVTFAALASMWVLFGIERDSVISRLRDTTPGRINFSWEFARRVAIYGILPLLAVIGALFPEIGQPIFSWLGPLQKLVTF